MPGEAAVAAAADALSHGEAVVKHGGATS